MEHGAAVFQTMELLLFEAEANHRSELSKSRFLHHSGPSSLFCLSPRISICSTPLSISDKLVTAG